MDIKIPPVGESISEVTLGSWLVKDGDYIDMDQPIAELESDKAAFELPAEASGVIKISVEEGETIDVGSVIGSIDTSKKPTSNNTDTKLPVEAESTQPEPINAINKPKPTGKLLKMLVPTVGESITEVTLAQWIKKQGEHVNMDEPIAELESDKATFELPAEENGVLTHKANEGDTIPIGNLIAEIAVTDGPLDNDMQNVEGSQQESQSTIKDVGYASNHPSPAASKILAEKNIGTTQIQGTGRDGRITKQDAIVAKQSADTKAKTTSKETDDSSKVQGERGTTRKKMSALRKTVSKRLVAAKNTTAMLTTFNEVDMKPIMDIRSKYKVAFKEKYEVNLGFMSFFTKAVCLALQEWPSVGAMIDGDEIIYHDFCDVSIAVSSPRGLVVPVIRNAEKLDFQGIESEVVRLAIRARDNKLTIEEMTGGNFTITNGGIFGSMLSTPIINAPQSAILGMHNIVQRPVAVDGQVVIRPVMFVALSYDHRIIDGRESVSFLYRIKELLEDPHRLMLKI